MIFIKCYWIELMSKRAFRCILRLFTLCFSTKSSFYSNQFQHDLKLITYSTLTFKSSTDLDNIAHDFLTANKAYFN